MEDIIAAGRLLTEACFGGSKASGWHNDTKTGLPRTAEENEALFPTRIALCHSELSEALEGHRKGLPDDKLPERPMAEVELADTVIRAFDLDGAMEGGVAAALAELIPVYAKYGSRTVGLAKALFTLFDTAGAMGYDLGGAIAEKLRYNASRADHKHAARNASGGKRY